MLKGPKQPKPSSVQLTSQVQRAQRGRGRVSASRGGGRGPRGEFVHAFADALRDILQDERGRAA